MEHSQKPIPISLDRPASVDDALQADKLDRLGFANEVVDLLRNVGADSSFALSVEGPWGSGKTQVLRMIEALLRDESQPQRPIVVHFNPWLVGEKDALLRQFFGQVAEALTLSAHVKNAENVAKQLISYAKVFDIVKWVPGAEPWASIMKGVIDSMGAGVQAVAEQKTPGLEEQKLEVERALRQFDRRIIVFIDDVDRLYPQEAFEMIRIIKSVGDLPNIGYVVAWDHAYVSAALGKASVPFPESYLDKVIQQRVPIPLLSSVGRERLIEDELKKIDQAAFEQKFRRSDRRYAALYVQGVFDLLENPRDVVRAFNVLRTLEKRVRGNVVFADLIAFSILQIKAAPVCELLRKNRRWFVGKNASDLVDPSAGSDNDKKADIEAALARCALPWLVRRVMNYLFPLTFNEKAGSLINASEGHIGDPERLEIVLKMGADNHDIDYILIRNYILDPHKRQEIEADVPASRAYEFMTTIANFVEDAFQVELSGALPSLCVSLAVFADGAGFSRRARNRGMLQLSGSSVAFGVLQKISKKIEQAKRAELAKSIAIHPRAISMAAYLIDASYTDQDEADSLRCRLEDRETILHAFHSNTLDAARIGLLSSISDLGYVLHVLHEHMPQSCPALFELISMSDLMLDAFVLALSDYGIDSVNGQRYAIIRNLKDIESFCTMDSLRRIAQRRLNDEVLAYPERAAWMSIENGKIYYGVDGTEAMS